MDTTKRERINFFMTNTRCSIFDVRGLKIMFLLYFIMEDSSMLFEFNRLDETFQLIY